MFKIDLYTNKLTKIALVGATESTTFSKVLGTDEKFKSIYLLADDKRSVKELKFEFSKQ